MEIKNNKENYWGRGYRNNFRKKKDLQENVKSTIENDDINTVEEHTPVDKGCYYCCCRGPRGPQGEVGPAGPVGVWESAGIQLINKEPRAGEELVIHTGEVIPFDTVVEGFNGVTYSDGKIHIHSTGYYLFSWEFIARPLETERHIIVRLEDTGFLPNVYGKSAAMSNNPSIITGTALVLVDSIPLTASMNHELLENTSYQLGGSKDYRLVNRSSGDIVIASAYNKEGDLSVYYAGSLTVYKIADLYWS
ncbi:hypothetical protein CS063_07650 [Sporanaerobium hydrogeniformans]|uniref:Uncharacterized protein n=1 Tax=Sporanaerobium hydrogeniformans TaxID=3072179 RepID=A0AC61DC90_9FIRM|nr:hypothetical protein [Sporanaerobium hydrogeniformans]PHV70889.1 hypothetical protein CS063_07650 [Sporanaerobium hydrogeniformans]